VISSIPRELGTVIPPPSPQPGELRAVARASMKAGVRWAGAEYFMMQRENLTWRGAVASKMPDRAPEWKFCEAAEKTENLEEQPFGTAAYQRWGS
jgi:hypothetical protein